MPVTYQDLQRGLTVSWRERLKEWPLPLPRFPFDVSRAALLVVDMQTGSADPNVGASRYTNHPGVAEYRTERMAVVIPNIERLVKRFREIQRPVIYLTVGHALPDRSDALPLLRQIDDDLKARGAQGPMVRFGSRENAVMAAIAPQPGELVINKTSMSAFNSTAIDQTLRNLGITTLVVVGVSTECCVAATAHDAADRGYNVILVEDGCRAVTPYLQECTLVVFAAMFGRVASTDEVLNEVNSARGVGSTAR
jgi:nicotinamidase-related amidase